MRVVIWGGRGHRHAGRLVGSTIERRGPDLAGWRRSGVGGLPSGQSPGRPGMPHAPLPENFGELDGVIR